MDPNLATLRTLLELGWPAIVLVECIILWRDNGKLRDKLISVLEYKDIDTRQTPTPTIHTGED
jgi:hypothetical protein